MDALQGEAAPGGLCLRDKLWQTFAEIFLGFLEVSKTIVLLGVRYSFYLDIVVLGLFYKEREEKGFVLSYLENPVSRVF